MQNQKGSALIYILIAISLLALLTSSLMESSNQQGQSQNSSNLIAEMQSQISLISSSVQECVLNYPNQDSELTTTEQKNPPYPIDPSNSYFTSQSATPGASTINEAQYIRCPGNPGGSGPTNQNHARIFGGSSGKFLPPPPNLFTPWYYDTSGDGVFLLTGTTKTDAYITSALTKLDAKYSPCEAEYIDATAGVVNISTGGATCPAGYKCFRFWIIRKPTAIPVDASCN